MARRALGPASLAMVHALDALPSGEWVVACSGGPDSLALAWAAGVVGRRRGTAVRAVVVDHGLQQGSAEVAAHVVATLAALPVDRGGGPGGGVVCVPAAVVTVSVVEDGAGPEASARTARYTALSGAARHGERVLLGHTLDDQAETVLLGLARGSGARSLAGMAPERGVFVRPLLGLGREVTAACCAEVGLAPWIDPHNADARFARVRVREVVLPMLERELGPGIRDALARTAALLRQDADALDDLAAGELDALLSTDDLAGVGPGDAEAEGTARAAGPGLAHITPETLSCRWLAGFESAVRDRVLRAWLITRGAGELTTVHVAAVGRLVTHWRGQKGVDVPGLRVTRRDGSLTSEPSARSR